jgi:hypothetical protein
MRLNAMYLMFGEPFRMCRASKMALFVSSSTLGEPKLTLKEPNPTLGEPKLTLREPKLTLGELKLTLKEPN